MSHRPRTSPACPDRGERATDPEAKPVLARFVTARRTLVGARPAPHQPWAGEIMGLVIVERRFAEATPFEEIQALEDRVAWCLEQHEVRFLRTYFSRNRRHMVCIYEAPDADAVRTTQRQGEIPFETIWSGKLLIPSEQAPPVEGLEQVVVQQVLPVSYSAEQVGGIMEQTRGCFDLYRAALRQTYLALDGMRMICVFDAPDAESVRTAKVQSGIPLVRAWSCSYHEPA